MRSSESSWRHLHFAATPLWTRSLVRPDALGLYTGASTTWALNSFKGALGEKVLKATVAAGMFEPVKPAWVGVTPHRVGATGLDSVFVRVDARGRIGGVMVAEAKFGASRLGSTRAGLQMSARWVRPHLLATARDYADAASAFRDGTVIVSKLGSTGSLHVPLPGGRVAAVRVQGRVIQCSERIDARTLVRRLRATSSALRSAAERGDYATRLFKIQEKRGELVFEMQRLDRDGVPVGRMHTAFKRPWAQLSGRERRLVLDCVRETLGEHIDASADSEKLARELCRDPSLLSRFRLIPRSRWLIGVDRSMAVAAGCGASVALLLQLGPAIWRGEKIHWSRVGKSVALSGATAAASYWLSAQVQHELAWGSIGRVLARTLPLRSLTGTSAALGGLASSVATGAIAAVGAYTLGLVDKREATVMGVASTAGALAGAIVGPGAFAAASTFGTAGTGTAIASLSGAAAKSATLAWIGGSVAAGSTILTLGTTAVVLAVGAGVQKFVAKLDEKERERLLLGRMALVERSLRKPV